MKELEQAVRPVILQVGRPLAELAPALPSFEPEDVMASLGMDPAIRFDFVVGRDLFTRLPAGDRLAVMRLLLAVLARGGALSVAQVIPRLGQRLSALVPLDGAALFKKLAAAEERAYSDPSSDLVSWSLGDLEAAFREAGARDVSVETEPVPDTRRITEREMELWLAPDASYGRALCEQFSPEELASVRDALRSQLVGRETSWTSMVAFVVARV